MTEAVGDVKTGIGIRTMALLAFAGAGLAGCGIFGGDDNSYVYQGVTFAGDAKALSGDRASFVSTAGPASASLEGAIGGARFEGTKYCIDYLGTSDIAWTVGPDAPAAQIPVQDDEVRLSGTCLE